MSKIMDLINYKKIIHEDRKRHVDTMNDLIDRLKDDNVPEETREELVVTAKGMLATNAILEETNGRLEQAVGRTKGIFMSAIAVGVGYGVGTVIGHLITKGKK